MVNVTRMTDVVAPASSTLPDTLSGFQHDTTQYSYSSASGTLNDVVGGVPGFLGVARLSVTLPSGNATWTGYAAGYDGQHIVLTNIDTTNTLTLSTGGTGLGNTASLAQNRFFGQNDLKLPPGAWVTMIYYAGATPRWRIG